MNRVLPLTTLTFQIYSIFETEAAITTPQIVLTVGDVATPGPTGGAPGGPWSPLATHCGPPGAADLPGLRNGGRAGAAVAGAVVVGAIGWSFVGAAAPNFWPRAATLFGVLSSSSRSTSSLSFVGENRFAFVGRSFFFTSITVFCPGATPAPPFTTGAAGSPV